MKDDIIYKFNNFEFEVKERRLLRGREKVLLTPKCFDLLRLLIENNGKVVEKEFLLEQIWGETFVEEATLARNISTLRKALGKRQSGESFIETVPRCGYRFAAEVKKIDGDAETLAAQRNIKPAASSESEISAVYLSNAEEVVTAKINSQMIEVGGKRTFRHKGFYIYIKAVALCTVILLLGALLFGSYLRRKPSLASSKFERIDFSKLTTGGDIQKIALSPDGKYLAYVVSRGENQSLMLRQLADEHFIEVIPQKKQQYTGITFSPDSSSIYYVARNSEILNSPAARGILYKIPLLGGAGEKIIEDVQGAAAISSQTGQIAFVRFEAGEKKSALMIADESGRNERKIAERTIAEPFGAEKGGLAWSPDERSIAVPVFAESTNKQEMQLAAVYPESGRQEILTSQKWTWIGQPAWFKDGSGILFPANGEQSQNLPDGLWAASLKDGGLRQITGEINGFFGISLTADSNEIAAVQSDRLMTFWTSSIENPKQSDKITQSFSGLSFFPLGLSYTPDGQIVYASTKNGNVDIWTMDSEGNNQKQLTSNASADFEPVVSFDGKFIFYLSNRNGRRNIWQMNIDGTEAKQLTDGRNINSPSVTADGKWIYYGSAADDSRRSIVWRMPLSGGGPEQITFVPLSQPKISPDGRFIACYYPDTAKQDSESLKLTILSTASGNVIKQFNEPPERNETSLAWTADSSALIFLKKSHDISNLWRQPIAGNAPRQLTDSAENIVRFAVSSAGRNLIYEKGTMINNVVLIREPGDEIKN